MKPSSKNPAPKKIRKPKVVTPKSGCLFSTGFGKVLRLTKIRKFLGME